MSKPRALSLLITGLLAAGLQWGHARETSNGPTLGSVYAKDFLIGVALNTSMVNGSNPRAAEIVARQFTALTAENDMKWQSVHPAPDRYHTILRLPMRMWNSAKSTRWR